jgi:hypothetical protein
MIIQIILAEQHSSYEAPHYTVKHLDHLAPLNKGSGNQIAAKTKYRHTKSVQRLMTGHYLPSTV